MSAQGQATGTLQDAFARLRELLTAARADGVGAPASDIGPAGPADALAACFGLDRFERDLILLAAFAELEPDAGELMAELQGSARLTQPSVALAVSLLPQAHWTALAPTGALRANDLLELHGDGRTAARELVLPERVLQYLLGVDALDETLALLSRPLAMPRALPDSRAALARRIAAVLRGDSGDNEGGGGDGDESDGAPVVQLCGADRAGKLGLIATAAAQIGRPAYAMDAETVPANARERALLARRWAREQRIDGTVLMLDAGDITTPQETRALTAFVELLPGPVVLAAASPVPLPHASALRIDVPRIAADEQVTLWHAALGGLAGHLNGTIERLAAHFTLSPESMAAVARDVHHADPAEAAAEDAARLIWEACRRQARPRLDDMAERIDGEAGWQDIVLPEQQKAMLAAIAAQVRQRVTVYERWRLAGRGTRGLGINALFSGISGTGKTLAAEILGNALELDVYRIDLSSVVSKWIGETEKNLKRVFDAAEDGGAVLLFDEADALFGKRSDVKDSHDRYANIEVSYLLQRMEAYRGLAILTTNLRSHIDDAFLRRLRFIVDFPFPGAPERREIWSRMFPSAAPTEGLDFDRLAQLTVPGGSIRNIAVNAAFLAADRAQPVAMGHILAAARAEYEKIGKPLTHVELRGWAA